jgi:hypothetical protein
VHVETEANLPTTGDVRLHITPRGAQRFVVNVRLPGWAKLRRIDINGQPHDAPIRDGYARLDRPWDAGDCVDVHFDLPLRVVLDDGQGPREFAKGKVSLDGGQPTATRSVAIYRGPAILAEFRLQGGVEMIWAYTGDDPHLFETAASSADQFTLAGKEYRMAGVPTLTQIVSGDDGVRLCWSGKTGPGGQWTLEREVRVRPAVPLVIDFSTQITAPPSAGKEELEEALRTGRFCGTRMLYDVSEPSTYFDKVGYRVPPRERGPGTLDNGFVQYAVTSPSNPLTVVNDKAAFYRGIYCLTKKSGDRTLSASCTLTVSGQSRFHGPTISMGKGE